MAQIHYLISDDNKKIYQFGKVATKMICGDPNDNETVMKDLISLYGDSVIQDSFRILTKIDSMKPISRVIFEEIVHEDKKLLDYIVIGSIYDEDDYFIDRSEPLSFKQYTNTGR